MVISTLLKRVGMSELLIANRPLDSLNSSSFNHDYDPVTLSPIYFKLGLLRLAIIFLVVVQSDYVVFPVVVD